MNNKLLLVCPFSMMENFIRERYGDDVFFITAMAAVLHFDGEEISAIKKYIKKEKIQKIIIASDTSCRFINRALKNEKELGSYSETIINKIILQNRAALTKTNSEEEKQKIIANSIVKNQVQEICNPDLFLSEILKNKIAVMGIITTKSNNELTELNYNNN